MAETRAYELKTSETFDNPHLMISNTVEITDANRNTVDKSLDSRPSQRIDKKCQELSSSTGSGDLSVDSAICSMLESASAASTSLPKQCGNSTKEDKRNAAEKGRKSLQTSPRN